MRVVIADDTMLVRSGLALLLGQSGITTVGEAADADALLRLVAETSPDAAIVDIRMPPTHTDEGIVAARRIRERFPQVAVLVLSQHVESSYAMRLLADDQRGVGYLLKDRIAEVETIIDALRRIAAGDCVLDPEVVARMLRRARTGDPLDDLTPREREVLGHMAEGRSNKSICEVLHLSLRTVETHVGRIFTKLGIEESADSHRRVVAVLAYLRG